MIKMHDKACITTPFLFKLIFLIIYVCDCFAYVYVCVPCRYLVHKEVRRGLCLPENWSYGQL